MPTDVDIIEILQKLSSMGLVRLNKQIGDWYSVYCPFHNDGNERKASCGVSLVDVYKNGQHYPIGSWHCFACQVFYTLPQGISVILKNKNIDKSGYDWLVENIPGFEFDESEFDYLVPQDTMNALNSKYAVNYLQELTTPKAEYIKEEELSKYRYTVPYMYQRGLTDEIIERYDIGVDLNYIPSGLKKPVPCITFPVRDINGNVLFVARRAIEKKAFYLPDNIEKPLYGIYELPKGCKSVDIVESIFNLTNCVKYGRPAIALFGTGTYTQRQQLKRLGMNEFRIGLDPDNAGRKGTAKLKKDLKQVAMVWEYKGIPEDKDINDLTEEEFKNLLIE